MLIAGLAVVLAAMLTTVAVMVGDLHLAIGEIDDAAADQTAPAVVGDAATR